jgi:hypothetical protein
MYAFMNNNNRRNTMVEEMLHGFGSFHIEEPTSNVYHGHVEDQQPASYVYQGYGVGDDAVQDDGAVLLPCCGFCGDPEGILDEAREAHYRDLISNFDDANLAQSGYRIIPDGRTFCYPCENQDHPVHAACLLSRMELTLLPKKQQPLAFPIQHLEDGWTYQVQGFIKDYVVRRYGRWICPEQRSYRGVFHKYNGNRFVPCPFDCPYDYTSANTCYDCGEEFNPQSRLSSTVVFCVICKSRSHRSCCADYSQNFVIPSCRQCGAGLHEASQMVPYHNGPAPQNSSPWNIDEVE